jgi:hypothetical protein
MQEPRTGRRRRRRRTAGCCQHQQQVPSRTVEQRASQVKRGGGGDSLAHARLSNALYFVNRATRNLHTRRTKRPIVASLTVPEEHHGALGVGALGPADELAEDNDVRAVWLGLDDFIERADG